MEIVVELLDFAILTEDSEEDIFEAMNWFYSPWPYVDNGDDNKRSLGQVGLQVYLGKYST